MAVDTSPAKALGPLIVLSGPSGVGKSTVVNELLARNRYPLRRAITATSRSRRAGELDEVDYHFWTVERFERAIAAGEMLEHAIVHGKDHYGTPRAEVDDYRPRGIGVILVIDVQGAEQVRKLYPGDHESIFLTVPTEEILRQRLESRGTEDETKIATRLKTAHDEWLRADEFDHRVLNLDLASAVQDLERILQRSFSPRGLPCSMT